MSDKPKLELSVTAETLVGALVGVLIGGALLVFKVVSLPGAVGVAVAIALGSGFNAWRRARRKE